MPFQMDGRVWFAAIPFAIWFFLAIEGGSETLQKKPSILNEQYCWVLVQLFLH
jgi:hypothetical protein